MADQPPVDQLVSLALRPSNINGVVSIMNNPVRQITQLQIQAMESFLWSLMSTEGDISKVPIAAGAFIVERIDDPAKIAKIIMINGAKQGGV